MTVINNITPDVTALFGDDIALEVYADGHNLLYQWQKDEDQIPEGTGPVLSVPDVDANAAGLYRVQVSGSCGEVLSKNVYVYVTNKENPPDPGVFVWPTLVSSDFNVALSDGQTYNLRLFNSTGKLIKEKRDCQYKTTLDISDFPGGVYILTVSGKNFRKSVKLIRDW